MKHKKILPFIIACLLTTTACERTDDKQHAPQENATFKTQKSPQAQRRQPLVQMQLPDFARLVEEVGSSVVNVQAQRIASSSSSPINELFNFGFDEEETDPFFDFFRYFSPDDKEDSIGFGSGFIISNDGYILTNAHVVKDAESIKVTLTDKHEFPAKLIGLDIASDTALLKIEATNLPAVKIGNPKDLRVGEWVMAIGSPFDFENTVTAGIVSAKKRSLSGENYIPFIQTDVAINPGNSGGPLFNLYGEVVGMNSQIYTRSGGFMGISFSVPIDVAIGVSEQLKKTGKVKRGELGVMIQNVSYDLSLAFGLDRARGALVAKILPNSPAAKTNLQVGDIILSANGENIESSSDLPLIVGYAAPNSVVKLLVWRKGKTFETEAVLSELNTNDSQTTERPQKNYALPADKSSFTLPEIGLTVAGLDKLSSTRYQLDGKGLMVIKAEKLAKKSGLQHGDIILSVGQTAVTDENSLRQALSEYKEVAPLYILRNRQNTYLPLLLK